MIGSKFIGLSLTPEGLQAVAIKQRRRSTQVVDQVHRPWSSYCLKPGFGQRNVLEERSFTATVGAALKTLGVKKSRIAVSLNDASGKMLITTLHEPLKRGQDGTNLLKWQVREHLPLEPEKIRLGYQIIGAEPGGKPRVLIAAANNDVLEQYENLLTAAGATPAVILFDSQSLTHYYHTRGLSDADHLLLVLTPASLTLQLFGDGRLRACRNRPAPENEKILFQEISRTLIDWESSWPKALNVPAYLYATTALTGNWQEALEGALGRKPLAPPQQNSGPLPQRAPTPDFYAAIGAAERLFGVFP